MGIFDDIGGWISGAARDIYDTALKPIGNAIAGGVEWWCIAYQPRGQLH